MSSICEIVSNINTLGEIFEDRPLSRFASLNITADQIHNEALRFDLRKKVVEETDEKNVRKLGQIESFASTSLNQCFDQTKQILDGFDENKAVGLQFE